MRTVAAAIKEIIQVKDVLDIFVGAAAAAAMNSSAARLLKKISDTLACSALANFGSAYNKKSRTVDIVTTANALRGRLVRWRRAAFGRG